MEFQRSYFKSCKMMLRNCCTQYASKFGKFSSGHRTGKGQFSLQFQRKAMTKSIQTTAQLHSSHMLAKYCSTFSKPGFNSTWTMHFQMFKLDLENAGEPDQIVNIHWIMQKAREFQKNTYFCFIDYVKALTVWITTNCGKFFKKWEYQTTWSTSWEIYMQFQKQQLELYMEEQTGSKLGKKYVKAVYCHPAYLTYMQSTSWERLGWMEHKLEWRLLGEISITWVMQMIPHLWQKAKKN